MASPHAPLADRSAARYLLSGIPFVIFLGTLTHFIFDWSGNIVFVGLFVPINESVWEHLKMSFWPTLVWFLLVFLFFRIKSELSASRLLMAAAAALFVCSLIIVTFFYTMEGAFGIESLLVDASIFFLGIIVGQFAAVHVYRYAETTLLAICGCFFHFAFHGPAYFLHVLATPPAFVFGQTDGDIWLESLAKILPHCQHDNWRYGSFLIYLEKLLFERF